MRRSIELLQARVFVLSRLSSKPGWLGLLFGSFVLGMATSFVFPFMSLWGMQSVGMTSLGFGIFMTITSLSAMVLGTLLARWSDTRAPRRTVLLLGGLGGVLGYTGYAFVTDPVLLTIIGALLLGVASAGFSQLFAHAREELSLPEHGGVDPSVAMSLLRASFSLAWTVGPALGALVLQRFNYRGTFLVAASLFAIFVAVVWRFVPARPPQHSPDAAAGESLGRSLTRPVLLIHFAAFALVFAASALNMMNLPLLMTEELGGSAHHVGLAFAIAPVAEMPLMVWFGRLAARGHQVAVIRFGVLMSVVYFAALALARAPVHVYPLQLLSAASVAVTMSVAIPYFQDLLPGQTGVATSVYSSSYSFGCLLGYFSFGVLLESIGHRGITLLALAFGVLSLAMLVLMRRAPRSVPERSTTGRAELARPLVGSHLQE